MTVQINQKRRQVQKYKNLSSRTGGDNSGMSLGYLINYALLPCQDYISEGSLAIPGGGRYCYFNVESEFNFSLDLSCIMDVTEDYIESPNYPHPVINGRYRHIIDKRNSGICQIK